MNAQNVKDMRLADGADKGENHEPWMDYMEEAKEKIEKCFKNKTVYTSGYCRVIEKLSAQPVDLWGWATQKNGVIEMKVQYGMGQYPPQQNYHFSIKNWDVMWVSPGYYIEMVSRFMQQAEEAEDRAAQKQENDAMLAREKKIQDELLKKRLEVLQKELAEVKAHPIKFWLSKFKREHLVDEMPRETPSPAPPVLPLVKGESSEYKMETL